MDGYRIHYIDIGVGERAVILIHGWTCDASFLRLQMHAFWESGRVIAVDLPGHGLSDKPRVAYTPARFSRAVQEVLKDAGVHSAVLVGHSMGAAVARQFLLDYPDVAAGIVIVDGAV